MAGTGIHGYTGTSANGLYNISNGIIQSSSPSTNGTSYYNGNSGLSSAINSLANTVASSASNSVNTAIAQNVAGLAGTSPTEYGDYIRQLMQMAENNTAQSQAFAREQMQFQRNSDATAMAWSAQEAQKNRAWQESLADTAHQREVRDLVAAGLNPILSANAGAYTGSGATGQGFSSQGSMGQVDTSASNAIGALVSSMMNAAANTGIAKLYTDAERYNSDLQYSASRMATEASIMNNQNSTSAQKWIASEGYKTDLAKAEISGQYGLASAQANAGGMIGSASISAAAARDVAQLQKEKELAIQKAKQNHESTMQIRELEAQFDRLIYQTENGSMYTVGGMKGIVNEILDPEKNSKLVDRIGTALTGNFKKNELDYLNNGNQQW